eukprot:GHVU01069876.1.p1 GENE.GHVU01069876.1~~GHVU01069876.1.p1  ORF type:complete len:148 (+),score=17.23 GHVU01069876.1:599-1042(+)
MIHGVSLFAYILITSEQEVEASGASREATPEEDAMVWTPSKLTRRNSSRRGSTSTDALAEGKDERQADPGKQTELELPNLEAERVDVNAPIETIAAAMVWWQAAIRRGRSAATRAVHARMAPREHFHAKPLARVRLYQQPRRRNSAN